MSGRAGLAVLLCLGLCGLAAIAWLGRLAIDAAGTVGAVARAAQQDPAWPKRTDALPRLDRSLRDRGATLEARRALRRASGEWLLATAGEVR